jgi:hypothetical protein
MFNRAGQGFTAGSELQIGARCSGVLRQVGVFEFILGGGGRGGGDLGAFATVYFSVDCCGCGLVGDARALGVYQWRDLVFRVCA